MKRNIFSIIFGLFCVFSNYAQTLDTLTICNGDSVLIFNNWEYQTGNYTNGFDITTLIVNPTPTVTGSFILNGNANQSIPGTYTLTQALNTQSGSAWNSVTLNLSQPFEIDVDMFFGFNNGGADGIAFVLQQVSTSVGTGGGGMGYQGITPSFAVEFDTWQNNNQNDPFYDHLAIQRNGNLFHAGFNNLFGPVGLPPGLSNIEDGNWHNVIFTWNPTSNNFRVRFDGVLIANYTNNIVASIFGNNPNIYWGFTAATGGANNLQRFRVNSLEISLGDQIICSNDTILISSQVNTSAYSYLWSPNYNITNNTLPSTTFFPDTTNLYVLEVTNSYGCSITDSFTVFVNPTTTNILTQVACDSYFWPANGQTYTSSGNYVYVGTNSSGCQQVDSLYLTINNSSSTVSVIAECDMYVWPLNGQVYTSSGLYTDTSTNSFGCLQTDTLDLTINYSSYTTISIVSCDTFFWPINGITYFTSGIYTDSSFNSSGCLHIDSLTLIINNSTINTTNITECYSYLWPITGTLYDSSGTFVNYSLNADSCTNTEILNLIINDSTSNLINIVECDSFLWPVNNQIYTTSGIYTNVSINSAGCIHIDSLNLSLKYSTYTTITATNCDSYSWAISGQTYTVSGTYINTSVNIDGCTHIDSLFLTINYSTINTTVDVACDSYIWWADSNYYDTSGTYVILSTNNDGCTHSEELNLIVGYTDDLGISIDKNDVECLGYDDGSIILNPTGGSDPYQFFWDDGSITQGLTSLSPGTYPFTIVDANGCQLDSSATVNEANEIFVDFIATSPICRYEESILSININSALSNTFTLLLDDSVQSSFVLDTNGLLIPEGTPITLTPNFSGKVNLISLTDALGCTQIFNDSVHIEVKQLPVLAINEDDICFGEPSYNLVNATPNGGTYFINNEMTSFFDVENLDFGAYKIRYEYTDPATNCYNEITDTITISDSPQAEMLFSPQSTDLNNPEIFFRDNSDEEIVSSIWDLGDGTIVYDDLNFYHTYLDTGSYDIRYYVTNQYGCIDSVFNTININPIYSVFIPDAFTPNNDGDNDVFMPSIIGSSSYNIKIFDRWGSVIYNEDNKMWNGKINENLVNNGTYPYSVTVTNYNGRIFIYTGTVTIVK